MLHMKPVDHMKLNVSNCQSQNLFLSIFLSGLDEGNQNVQSKF